MRSKITEVQKEMILNLEENHFNELKAKEIKPNRLSVAVSAFSNASGGEIYVGIKEIDRKNRVWEGFEVIEEANHFLQMLNMIAPLASFIKHSFLECDGAPGVVLKIEILKNNEIIKTTEKKIFIRNGAQSQEVSTEEAKERLLLNKGMIAFEDRTISIAKTDVIVRSPITKNFLLYEVPTAKPEEWLKKEYLIIEEHPTVAGILLFAEEPQPILPKRSAIKIFHYKTSNLFPSREHLAVNPVVVEGCVIDLIYKSVEKTKEIINQLKKLTPNGIEEVKYPDVTLHEIIANAVIHRDYSIQNDIQIRIFENRIEIESPGNLPGHITPQNIFSNRVCRNSKIVRILYKFPDPPIKDGGEGLKAAFDAMERLRLKSPVIEDRQFSVLVTIPHEKLASPEETILEFLKTEGEISNKKARELCGIYSENKMKRLFQRLAKRKLIEPVPDRTRPKAAWRLYTGHSDALKSNPTPQKFPLFDE